MNQDEFSAAEPAPRGAPLSKTPSWIMLGFLFGAFFVWALPRRAPPVAAREFTATPAPVLSAPRFTTIEGVFADWNRHAVWHSELTEVALWNAEAKAYADSYEVLRVGDSYYFRSILRLTRPLLTHGGIPANSPLQFTETEEQRQEWLRERNQVSRRTPTESVPRVAPPPKVAPEPNRD